MLDRTDGAETSAAGWLAQFQSALNDVKAKERILRRSLKEARNAGNADAWMVAQGTLAADYQAYATALAELNTVVQ